MVSQLRTPFIISLPHLMFWSGRPASSTKDSLILSSTSKPSVTLQQQLYIDREHMTCESHLC